MMLLEHTIAHYYSYYFISADYCYAKLNCNFTTIDYNFGYNIASFINNYYQTLSNQSVDFICINCLVYCFYSNIS